MPLTSVPSNADEDVRVWHYDGASAIRHEPFLIIEGDHFYLVEDTIPSAQYGLAQLVAREPVGGLPVYGLKGKTGWRIGFFEALPPALADVMPAPARYGGIIDRLGLLGALAIFAAITAITLLLLSRTPAIVAKLVPPSLERKLGDLMIGDFGNRFCNGPGGRDALAALTRRLQVKTGSVDIEVANIAMVNAVTLPGGRIIIFDGLLKNATSADEVAGILAHELGHVEHRDVIESLLRQLGLSVILGGLDGNIGGYTNALLSTAYSRGAERRADDYAIEALNRSRISPLPTADFFKRLAGGEAKNKNTVAWLSYLSTHPVSATRAESFTRSAKGSGGFLPALAQDDWKKLKTICSADQNSSKSLFPF